MFRSLFKAMCHIDRSRSVAASHSTQKPRVVLKASQSITSVCTLRKILARNAARTREGFGCMLVIYPEFLLASQPTDTVLSSEGCRCLSAELFCDRRAHCHNGSDEWPDTCA